MSRTRGPRWGRTSAPATASATARRCWGTRCCRRPCTTAPRRGWGSCCLRGGREWSGRRRVRSAGRSEVEVEWVASCAQRRDAAGVPRWRPAACAPGRPHGGSPSPRAPPLTKEAEVPARQHRRAQAVARDVAVGVNLLLPARRGVGVVDAAAVEAGRVGHGDDVARVEVVRRPRVAHVGHGVVALHRRVVRRRQVEAGARRGPGALRVLAQARPGGGAPAAGGGRQGERARAQDDPHLGWRGWRLTVWASAQARAIAERRAGSGGCDAARGPSEAPTGTSTRAHGWPGSQLVLRGHSYGRDASWAPRGARKRGVHRGIRGKARTPHGGPPGAGRARPCCRGVRGMPCGGVRRRLRCRLPATQRRQATVAA
jgi:hypothetical protein